MYGVHGPTGREHVRVRPKVGNMGNSLRYRSAMAISDEGVRA